MTVPALPTAPTTAQIREQFLHFFESKGHLRLASHSTIAPDPTTLFTVAGMQPFKAQFMGAPARFEGAEGVHKRVTTAQKCLRVGDIENVGRTLRHCSLLEMLGNFSFGDYFKRESLTWAWEFLTSPDWMALDASRLYATIYEDDQEAYDIWTQEIGLPADHILRFGADENFWPADAPLKGPNGPCGPCSEIFYDRGPKYGDDTWAEYADTRESARFLEIWNNVFPQFDRQEPQPDGTPTLSPLPFKNIDTGMGLERIATVVQDVYDFYSNDVFAPIVARVAELSGKPYEGPQSVSHRVVAEHIRSVSMVIADGVQLSNTGRGYTVRKILRRASRHAYLLGLHEPVLHTLVPLVVEKMGGAYPELVQNEARVTAAIRSEEERFLKTLEQGTQRLDALLGKLEKGAVLSGDEAFTLYDTYGFPVDLTKEIAEEYGIGVDEAGYAESLERAQELARAGSKYGKSELFGGGASVLDDLAPTEFIGYDELDAHSKVLALLAGGENAGQLSAGDEGTVVLDRTPFYAEGGGEVGDIGLLEWPGGEATVRDTTKTKGGVFLHTVAVVRGELKDGDDVRALVDASRQATERHHTATHLLQAALRAVLGEGVHQAGSLVAPDRLRFDFSHAAALSAEEVARVELLVNRWIQADSPVNWQTMPIAQARTAGATALFGEKYGDVVRVVTVERGVPFGDHTVTSMELCGGAHVTRTGEIGSFVIVSDENVAAGVRRIEALAGEAAVQWTRAQLVGAQRAAALLNTSPEGLAGRIENVQATMKASEKEAVALRRQITQLQMGGGGAAGGAAPLREIGGYRVAALKLSGIESGELRGAADTLLEQSGADLVVIATDKGLVVKATKDAVARGAHAGQLVGKLAAAAGGKGGGRPDMAQAGIQDADAALAALDSSL
ncbi:alanine--tRNA ligase [Deinococcus sp. KNUC1210]|uniref:alanine--tRNA ligase n=1 Tax=Deinococcus sp. KNUC1210 TaxID=2917691 RepID=UPI001EF14198|nr:alanine--tRNA ligase [Deinococcus sp. KNUC1210]ULH16796.1 alanine--tRNA ligase [Deinococcus sp. KNUC1210]